MSDPELTLDLVSRNTGFSKCDVVYVVFNSLLFRLSPRDIESALQPRILCEGAVVGQPARQHAQRKGSLLF